MNRRTFLKSSAILTAGAHCMDSVLAEGEKTHSRWYRGNLHMHTFRSDGQAFPEEAAALYKRLGYDFVALTDHNSTHEDPNYWLAVGKKNLTPAHIERYRANFPNFSMDVRTGIDGTEEFRLKTFDEMSELLNEPERFLMISGNEVSSGSRNGEELHVNFINTRRGNRVRPTETGKENLLWTLELRDEYLGADNPDAMYVVNHPLWRFYDVDPRSLIEHPSIRFMEVANVDARPLFPAPAEFWDHDKFWDIVNAFRAENGDPLLFGTATDDTHGYSRFYEKPPYLGFVMVRAEELTTSALIHAMHRGDFYATNGLILEDVVWNPESGTLSVSVEPEPGYDYTIQFIGTRKNFDHTIQREIEHTAVGTIPEWAIRQNYVLPTRKLPVYSDDIGCILSEEHGLHASYTLGSDDLYVRARVITQKGMQPSMQHPTFPVAWTQPYRKS